MGELGMSTVKPDVVAPVTSSSYFFDHVNLSLFFK